MKEDEVGGSDSEMGYDYNILVRKPEGKRPLDRPRRRWEDNIRVDLKGMGRGSVDWICLAQDGGKWRAFVITVMNLRVA
jgi:hypothetical protein